MGYSKSYYEENKEKIRSIQKAYYTRNRGARLKYSKDYRNRPEIREKKIAYAKEYNSREDVKQNRNNRRLIVKQEIVDYKGGKCQICGYNKCLAALEFHHINGDKEFEIGRKILCISIKRLKAEIDKCILVCSNCHMEIHYGDKINGIC